MKLSLKEISKIIGASLEGERSKEIVGINTLEDATSEQISYAVSKKYLESLANTNAGAVIVDSSLIKYTQFVLSRAQFAHSIFNWIL